MLPGKKLLITIAFTQKAVTILYCKTSTEKQFTSNRISCQTRIIYQLSIWAGLVASLVWVRPPASRVWSGSALQHPFIKDYWISLNSNIHSFSWLIRSSVLLWIALVDHFKELAWHGSRVTWMKTQRIYKIVCSNQK